MSTYLLLHELIAASTSGATDKYGIGHMIVYALGGFIDQIGTCLNLLKRD